MASESGLVSETSAAGALRRLGLLGQSESGRWTALTGGVSSDIWCVELSGRTVCVKRARPVLAVAAEWHAPLERNESEVRWLEVARKICPGSVPEVLGHLPDAHLFVMEHLDPREFPVWKRTAKWNEGLRIADALGNGGLLPDPKNFPWGAAR